MFLRIVRAEKVSLIYRYHNYVQKARLVNGTFPDYIHHISPS